jgi:hypothetical protein
MKRKRRGLLLHVDDLEVGQQVTVHHWKDRRPDWMGVALEITAINLPFVAFKALSDENFPTVPLDIRHCVLMPITPEFVQAQMRRPAEN